MAILPGMIGSGDWQADERPLNWRQAMLYQYPNGDMPLTALLSKYGSESTDDAQFNWWTKTLQQQGGAFTATQIYTDIALTSAYGAPSGSNGIVGQVLFVKVAQAVADHFREGHQALIRNTADPSADVNAKVLASTKNGAASFITIKLLEADDNSLYSTDMRNANYIMVVGNINPEGGGMPAAIAYEPVKFFNYTQIWRTSLEITRTARKTKLRTYDQYKEAKREAMELHGIEMERSLIFGVASEGTGANGKPERTTRGVINFIRETAPQNVDDYSLSSTYNTLSWTAATGGKVWLRNALELMFRFGGTEKLALVGNGALLGLQALAEGGSVINIEPNQKIYGMNIRRWITPFGDLMLKTHPLFNIDPVMRNAMLILEPQHIKERILDDTRFKKDTSETEGGSGKVDGTREEWLTELGLEVDYPENHGLLLGVGVDNA